jgi:hypothetical protein
MLRLDRPKDRAIDWLQNAFRKGYWNYPYVARHSTVFRKRDGHPDLEDSSDE